MYFLEFFREGDEPSENKVENTKEMTGYSPPRYMAEEETARRTMQDHEARDAD